MGIIINKFEPNDAMRFAREKAECTRSAFSEIMGLKEGTITGYELGRRRFSFEIYIKALILLNHTLIIKGPRAQDDIVINGDPENKHSPKEVIKTLREWTGKTQKDFSKDTGINIKTLQDYEQGNKRYYYETLHRITKKYNFIVDFEYRK